MPENEGVLSTIQEALEGVLGKYEPSIREYTIEETVPVVGASGVELVTYDVHYSDALFNWNWFGSFVVLIILLYSFFRAIGGMIKCRM